MAIPTCLLARRYRHRLRLAQQCSRCRTPVLTGVVCRKCSQTIQAARRARRRADIQAGRCVTCRRMPARPMGVECDYCADENRAKVYARRQGKKSRAA